MDEFEGGGPEPVDRGLGEGRVGHRAEPLDRGPVRGCDSRHRSLERQLRAAADHLIRNGPVNRVVLDGTNKGGSIAICGAADDVQVSAVALLSPRADFDGRADPSLP